MNQRDARKGPADPDSNNSLPRNANEGDIASDASSASSGLLHRGKEEASDRSASQDGTKATRYDRLIGNTWCFEAVAMVFSVACLIAIAVVLRIFEDKPSHPMAYGLTLNAIISTLATASKASLLCAIAGSLGQLKWDWFRTQRRVYDLQAFDDASRGPAGSIALLFRPRGVLAVAGAVITVIALVFDPFVQQVVQYPTRLTVVPGKVAKTSRALGFGAGTGSMKLISALNAGLWSDSDQFQRRPTCASGTCDWPTFKSLEWCSKCEDATASAALKGPACSYTSQGLKTTDPNCTVSIGGGPDAVVVQLGITEGGTPTSSGEWRQLYDDVVWTVAAMRRPFGTKLMSKSPQWAQNVTINGIKGPVLAVGHASMTFEEGQENFRASVKYAEMCVLTPCLKEYSLSTVNGTIDARILSTNYGVRTYQSMPDPEYDFGDWVQESCWQPSLEQVKYNYTGLILPKSNLLFDLYTYTNRTVPAFCPIATYGRLASKYLRGTKIRREDWNAYSGYTEETTIYSSDGIRVTVDRNLSYVMNNIAASLSKLALDESGEDVEGVVNTSETYVLVRWRWLILPIILVAAGLLLFLTTVLRTSQHRSNLWRSSLLPLLYHQLETSAGTVRAVPTDVARMEVEARRDQATLAAMVNSKSSSSERL